MALNVTATTVDTYINAALTAIDSGDYSTARKKVVAARTAIMALPDDVQDGFSTKYDRTSDLLKQITELEAIETRKTSGNHRVAYGRIGYGR